MGAVTMTVNVLENTHKPSIFKENPMDSVTAQTFLKMLDPTTSEFCFRTFNDKKSNISLANKYNANVVVMGYGEHQGWLSRIKGHTLDYVLNNLSCDLLALKQSNNRANKLHH